MLSICFLLFHVFFFYCKISKPLKFMASHSFYYYFFFSERARECDDSFNKIKSLTDTHWAINGLLFMCDSYCIWSYLSFQRKSIHLSAKTWVTSQLNKQRDTNCLLRYIRMLLCGCVLRKKKCLKMIATSWIDWYTFLKRIDQTGAILTNWNAHVMCRMSLHTILSFIYKLCQFYCHMSHFLK